MFYKKFGICAIFLFLMFTASYAQEEVLTLIPWNGDPSSYVEAQIIADTTATGGLLPNRVYELQREQIYLQDAILTIRAGLTLRIRAAAGTTDKPVIYLDEVPGTGRPPGNMIVLNGGNLEMKDVCVAGYFEFEEDRLGGIQGGLIQVGGIGSSIILDGVILSNTNGNHIRTNFTTRKIQVTNSIFANMGALTRSNLGAGKGLDLREVAHDTLILVNNTFVNFQDRAVRHLDLSDTNFGAINYALIDHNTFVNGMGYHGLLSLGNVGDQIIITNNLFVDAFALGEDSTDAVRTSEWLHTGETYSNGNNRMTWVIAAPNDITQWTISNNYYTVSAAGQAWLNDDHFGNGPFGIGSPLSYHVNSKLGADSVNAFINESGLTLNNIPTLMTNMMTWYEDPAGANRTKQTGTFVVGLHDYDRRKIQYYRDTLDASYSTTATAYTAAVDCFPVGDLNWFPDKKAAWESGAGQCTPAQLITVDGAKDDFYNTLTGPDDGYLQIRSYAHNANGIPDNDADLSAKVWTAWEADWFYFYAEVMDDVVTAGTTANVWETDNLELKFDPEPYDSVVNSIWDTRLTAPGITLGDSLNNITDAANKQFGRRIIPGGYALELAIKWTAIGTTENISVAVDSVFGLAINFHDNEGAGRVASVMWAAVMQDAVWNTPKYLGTIKFLADNKLQFIPVNTMTGVRNVIPYDGRDTTVAVEKEPGIPTAYSLSQNYPNPFNPSTSIEFAIPAQSMVELEVYDLLGERVAILINEEMSAGFYRTSFSGSTLPSGIYFYRIKAGSFVETKKLMLLK